MMKTLLPEQTQQVSGGIAREPHTTAATTSARSTGGKGVTEFAPVTTAVLVNAADTTRSPLPASVGLGVNADGSSGGALFHRFIRFDANRLAPGDPDVDDFNGLNDQSPSA